MSEHLDPADPDIVSKAEFARRRNVKPPRVTQWIEARKIHGDALVGEGRHARIRESVACQQLNRSLDISQRLGNGLGTRLALLSAAAPDTTAQQQPLNVADDARSPYRPLGELSTQDKIAQQRLIQVTRQNESDAVEHLAKIGRLVDSQSAKAAAAQQARQLITHFEGHLETFASAMVAQFKLPHRDVTHVLRATFLTIRRAIASDLRSQAAAIPAMASFELDDDAVASQPALRADSAAGIDQHET